MLQYSTVGVHKDELQLKMNGFSLKKFASQGQQKSFIIALKLAQFDIIAKEKGLKPLLLLDDIFDKLDEHRTTALMKLVSQQHFGQIFITDAHVERVAEILRGINCSFAHFLVEQGSITRNEA
jgi:DNA replication and repair protein RecF